MASAYVCSTLRPDKLISMEIRNPQGQWEGVDYNRSYTLAVADYVRWGGDEYGSFFPLPEPNLSVPSPSVPFPSPSFLSRISLTCSMSSAYMLPSYPELSVPLVNSIDAIVAFVKANTPIDTPLEGRIIRSTDPPRYFCRTFSVTTCSYP